MTHQPHHSPQHGGSLGHNGNRSPATLIVVLVGGLVVIAGAIVVVVMMNRDQPAGQPPPQPAAVPAPATAPLASTEPDLPPPVKTPPKPDVTASADEIIEKYTEAEKAADAGAAGGQEALKKVTDAYQGKIIEVTGQVFGRTDSDLVGYVISLGGGIEKTRGVRCALSDENRSQLSAITKGQTVTIRGKCETLAKDIELTECAVIAIKSSD